MREYIAVFILVFVAVVLALFITGTFFEDRPPKLHIGLPDQ